MEAAGTFFFAMTVVGLIVAVAWIVLPFALFGTKPLLRQFIAETRRTNELLEARLPPLNRGLRE